MNTMKFEADLIILLSNSFHQNLCTSRYLGVDEKNPQVWHSAKRKLLRSSAHNSSRQ